MNQDNPFIWGATSGGVKFVSPMPESFNVVVGRLPASYAGAVRRAVDQGQLDGYIREGNLYVGYSDLLELAGPGADTDDPLGGCHIPDAAYVTHSIDGPDR